MDSSGQRVVCSSGRSLMLSLDPSVNGNFYLRVCPASQRQERHLTLALFSLFRGQTISYYSELFSVMLHPSRITQNPVRVFLYHGRKLAFQIGFLWSAR